MRHLPWPYGQPAWRDVYRLQNLATLLEIRGVPDLSPSTKTASAPAPRSSEIITYTIAVRNNRGTLTHTIHLTDTVPAGLSYVPGSLVATLGTPDESDAPALHWSGSLSDTRTVTVTYAVAVTTPASTTQCIVNTVTVSTNLVGVLTRTATIIANGYTIHLPIILQGATR